MQGIARACVHLPPSLPSKELMRVWEGVLQEAVPSLRIDLDMPGGLKASAREA